MQLPETASEGTRLLVGRPASDHGSKHRVDMSPRGWIAAYLGSSSPLMLSTNSPDSFTLDLRHQTNHRIPRNNFYSLTGRIQEVVMAGAREEEQIPMTGDTLQQCLRLCRSCEGVRLAGQDQDRHVKGIPAIAWIGEISSRCGKNTGPTSRSPAYPSCARTGGR